MQPRRGMQPQMRLTKQTSSCTHRCCALVTALHTQTLTPQGILDPVESIDTLGKDDVATPESMQLALEAAEQSFVLLKNEGNLLPIKSSSKVALIGKGL